ncbi:MAG: lyase [Gemmatimonadota bacterium]
MRAGLLPTAAAAVAVAALLPTQLPAQALDVREWPVEWEGRPRDPAVDAQGRVWFVGQVGNYIGMFEPAWERFSRFEIEEATNPHNLIAGTDGGIWYAGNGNGRIGRLDPATGKARIIMMPDAAARDPHTLIQRGDDIWFTVQGGGHVGRLDMKSGEVELLKPPGERTRPYGIALDSKGQAWVNLFGTNRIVAIDPASFTTVRDISTPRADARTRRIAITTDDVVWYVDYAGGRLGRLDPGSGEFEEWVTPGGEGSQPYAMALDAQNRIWIAECARGATHLVGFDPKTKQFSHRTPVSSCIRHMFYHQPTRTIWFGTDANNIGRAILP